jgi:MFS family permease
MFITMGVAGLIGSLVWFRLYRDPAKTVLEPQDEAYLAENRAAEAPVELRNWGRLFKFRSMWGLMLGAFCTGYAVWMYQTWLPAYLEMQQHISIAKTGFLAMIPLVFSVLGAWAGGWVTDRFARGMEIVSSRRLPSILGLLLSGLFTIIATTASSGTTAVIWISAAMFFLSLGISCKWTLITAVAPQSYCTSVASIQNFGGYIGGTVSPLVTGIVVDVTGSFVVALAIGAGITVLGAVILQFVVRSPISAEALEGEGAELVPAVRRV